MSAIGLRLVDTKSDLTEIEKFAKEIGMVDQKADFASSVAYKLLMEATRIIEEKNITNFVLANFMIAQLMLAAANHLGFEDHKKAVRHLAVNMMTTSS